MQNLKAITLDLDDTLWPAGPALAQAEARLHQWLEENTPAVAAALPPPQFARMRTALAAQMPHLAHDFTALRHAALTRAFTLHGASLSMVDTALEVFLVARSTVTLYAEVPAALERLSGRYRLVALSNGNADIERAGVGRYFCALVNARSAGFAKPDPRIFHAACSGAGVLPAQALHAGDHPELDVRGAARAGMRAAWINRPGVSWDGGSEPFQEFHDLLALCEWLGV